MHKEIEKETSSDQTDRIDNLKSQLNALNSELKIKKEEVYLCVKDKFAEKKIECNSRNK